MSKYASEDIKERIKYYEDRENQVKQEGYDAGFFNGREVALENAQDAINKIIRSTANGGMSVDELREIFGASNPYYIFTNYTLREVIEALDKYDERNKIHVGDEVKVIGTDVSGVVTQVTLDNFVRGVCVDGALFATKSEKIEKTGNHFPEVSKMLEALRGGETE